MRFAVLTYEIFKREAVNLSYLAEALANNGFSVVVVHQALAFPTLEWLPPSICLLKSIDYGKARVVERLASKGHQLVCLEAESILVNPLFFPKTRATFDNLEKIHRYYLTGRYQRELCVKEFPNFASKFKDVGSLEVGANKLKNCSEEIVSDNPSILFCTGFGFFNHFLGPLKQRDMFSGYLDPEIQEGLIEKIRSYQIHAEVNFSSFLYLLTELARHFQSIPITIRVHPSESSEIWQTISKLYRNVNVDCETPITQQMKSHSLIICHPSTIAFQAHLVKRPCFVFESESIPIAESNYPHAFPHDLATRLYRRVPDLISDLSDGLNEPYVRRQVHAEVLEEVCTGSFADKVDTVEILERDFSQISQDTEGRFEHRWFVHWWWKAVWVMIPSLVAIKILARAYLSSGSAKYGIMKLSGKLPSCTRVSGGVRRIHIRHAWSSVYLYYRKDRIS